MAKSVSDTGWLVDQFEHARPHLASVAYGMLGSVTEAGSVSRRAPRFVAHARPAVVNDTAGLLFGTRDEPISVLSFTVSGGRIVELDMVSDPAKLRHLAVRVN